MTVKNFQISSGDYERRQIKICLPVKNETGKNCQSEDQTDSDRQCLFEK